MVEKVDDFIGRRFGDGGHLEVVRWGGKYHRSAKVYLVHCNRCAEDTEMFGDGNFECVKSSLIHGSIPCGCSRRHIFSKEQYTIKMRRWCLSKNYDFLGFVGDNINTYTRVKLRCNKDGNTWQTGSITTALHADTGCPVCGRDSLCGRKKVDSNEMISKFLENKTFLEGTAFRRSMKIDSRGNTPFWEVYCPKCSNDEYVREGLCCGVFTSYGTSLLNGQRPCRCSKLFPWTKEQREYQIKQVIESDKLDIVFKGWHSVNNKGSGRIILECTKHGHTWTPRLSKFLYDKSRCPLCATSGFSRLKQSSIYVILSKGVGREFTGYGITNRLAKRLQTHYRNLKRGGFSAESVVTFEASGDITHAVEKSLQEKFPLYPQQIAGFKTEATYYHLYDSVVEFIKEKLLEYPQVVSS